MKQFTLAIPWHGPSFGWSEELGLQVRAEFRIHRDRADSGHRTQGFPHILLTETLRESGWLIENSLDLATLQIQTPFVIQCKMNMILHDGEMEKLKNIKGGHSKIKVYKMVEKTHWYANNKFLLHNNGQPCGSRAGQIPLTHRGLK